MAPKRQITKSDKFADSHAATANFQSNAHPTSKRQRVEALPDDEDIAEESQPRCSSRAGKGSGGQLQQLRRLEHVQLTKHPRLSERQLAAATLGQGVNPMAPSYEPLEKEGAESQISPWLVTQARPSFTHAQSGDQFGFRLPKQAMTSACDGEAEIIEGRRRVGSSSILSSDESEPSSRSASVFSPALLRAASTTATSHAPSVFSDQENNDLDSNAKRPVPVVRDVEETPQQVPRRATQIRPNSFTRPPSSLLKTQTVSVVPSTVEETLVIDEASPSKDERFAKSNLHSISGAQRCEETVSTYDDTYHPAPLITTNFQRRPGSDTVSSQGAARGRDSVRMGIRATYDDEEHQDPGIRTWIRTLHDQGFGAASRQDAAYSRDLMNAGVRGIDNDDEHLESHLTTSIRHGEAQMQSQDQASAILSRDDDDHPDPNVAMRSQHSQGSGLVVHRSEAEDVVAQHRQCNRAPRLPSNASLLAVCDAQRAQVSGQSSRNGSGSNDKDDIDAPISASLEPLSADMPSASTESRQNLPHTNPSQLHFYPPPIHDIIERGKQFSHCDLASINAFPLRPQFNIKATDYINEAITERRSRGLTIPTGWWPNHSDGITKLLWEDIGNWRSALKKKVRILTRERYTWDPLNRRTANVDIAKNLLNGGAFLKDGADKDGHTNNLAHPALSRAIIDFFYTGQVSVGTLFPEVFAKEVPRSAVVLAATAIKVALDEIVAEGKDVAFKREVYADVYVDILGLMAKCDTSPVHRAKTAILRKQWAKIGTNSNGGTATSTGFDVDLD